MTEKQYFLFLQSKDLDFFIENSSLNDGLYQIILSVKAVSHYELECLRMFRYAYLDCYRSINLKHPEDDIEINHFDYLRNYDTRMYINEVELFMIMCMSFSIFSLQKKKNKAITRYIEFLDIALNNHGTTKNNFYVYKRQYESFIQEQKKDKKEYMFDFEKLIFDSTDEDITLKDWETATKHFNYSEIEHYITAADSESEQLAILASIQARYDISTSKDMWTIGDYSRFFMAQRELIMQRF